MAETVVEKDVCEKCGSDVREGTAFCYNCGASVNKPPLEELPKETDLEATIRMESNGSAPETKKDEKLSKAAQERKKARVSPRRTVEYTWQPANDSWRALIAAFVIFGIVLVVVAVMVFWK